jgi:ATP-binding cassette subfamily C (CFTR/MRP) protein 5
MNNKVRVKKVKVKDKRVGIMSEIIKSIRIIKMYEWEERFENKIDNVRKIERKNIKKEELLK